MKERIDKIISSQLPVSRKEVKSLMKKKEIFLNGEICSDPSMKADPLSDEIKVCGKTLEYRKYVYLMMNKPSGVICASNDKKAETVNDYLPDRFSGRDISSCGRLDRDTTGLLLLSDDGEFIHRVISPKKDVYKKYEVTLDRTPDEMTSEAFEKGIVIRDNDEDYRCMKAYFEKTGEFTAEISIKEGRYHQIKKMCHECGYVVEKLKRISIGSLMLDDTLKEGEVRELTEDEKQAVFE